MSASLGGVPHPVYTEETLQVTMSSWVTAKTFPLIKHRIHLQPWATGQQQQQEVMSWWQRTGAAWRLTVPQCSLLLHSPPSSPLSYRSQSCEKTLITIPKAAGKNNGSQLRAVAVTHAEIHTDWQLDQHTPSRTGHIQEKISAHLFPCFSYLCIREYQLTLLLFISLAGPKTLSADAARLCWCCGCCELIFRK